MSEDIPPINEPQTSQNQGQYGNYVCASCGYNLVGASIGSPCPECGVPVAQFGTNPGQTSGRAIASMVLGIVSLVTCFAYGIIGMPCAIIAIILSKKARLAVQDGTAPISSLGMAKAGKICGWIGVGLNSIGLLLLLFYVIFFIFALAAGAAGAAGGGVGP